jgi:hypothetical protein
VTDEARRWAEQILRTAWNVSDLSQFDEAMIQRISALVTDAVAESWAPTCTQTGKQAVGGVCPEHGGDGCLMASALLHERRRAVAYLRVLRDNHPHLRDAYEHAAINLEAALETGWHPLARLGPQP